MSNDLKKILGEMIGEASMCWSETPKGVFDSDKAALLLEKNISFIENLLEQEKKRMSEAVKESCSCSSHVDGCSGETYIDIVLSIINKKRVCQEVQK